MRGKCQNSFFFAAATTLDTIVASKKFPSLHTTGNTDLELLRNFLQPAFEVLAAFHEILDVIDVAEIRLQQIEEFRVVRRQRQIG